MVERNTEAFIDGFSVLGASFENLAKVLERYKERNLILNWEKFHFLVEEGIDFGHRIPSKGIEIERATIETIENLPLCTLIEGVRSFLCTRDSISDWSRTFPRSPTHCVAHLKKGQPSISLKIAWRPLKHSRRS